MKRKWNKIAGIVLSVALAVTSVGVGNVKSVKAENKAEANTTKFRDLDANTLTKEMGTGWNLGNSLDSDSYDYDTGLLVNSGETSWGNPKTTKAMIQKIHDLGFNTVRVPVTWADMIDDKTYKIDEDFLKRVKEVVSYALSQDMYVVLNVHHDGARGGEDRDKDGVTELINYGWIDITKTGNDWKAICKKYEGYWTSIANAFKDYNEHLVFEAMNEVWENYDMGYEQVNKELSKIMELNQIFVNVVRKSGSNNANRWLSVACRNTQIPSVTGTAVVRENGKLVKKEYKYSIPKDTCTKKRIMLTVHDYDAFSLAECEKKYKGLYSKFVRKGIPVLVSEYGYPSDITELNRIYQFEATNRIMKKYGCIPIVWDNNKKAMGDHDGYGYLNRETLECVSDEVVEGLMRGYYNEGDASEITKNQVHVELTDMTLSTSELTVGVDQKKIVTVTGKTPENNNDVVLWKTADDSIANVSNGRVIGRKEGSTTITAYSMYGGVQKTIAVTVVAAKADDVDDPEEDFVSPLTKEEEEALAKKDQEEEKNNQNNNNSNNNNKNNTTQKAVTITKSQVKYYVSANRKSATVTGVTDKNIKKVSIPATVTVSGKKVPVTVIAKNAFANKAKLTTVVIGNKVTTVGNGAFSGCKALKKVTIGSGVTSIGSKAFYKDKKLVSVTIKSTKLTKSKVGASAFAKTSSKAKVKVPKAKKTAYKKILRSKGLSKKAKVVS